MYVPFGNVLVSVACVMANRSFFLRIVRSVGRWKLFTDRVRARSAGERCSTFVGVHGAVRAMAESGQSMVLSTSSTAARAFVRRSHFCVGFSISYGRFVRGTGLETAVAARLSRLTHVSCALPPPCGLLGCLPSMRWWQSLHHQRPFSPGRVQSR